MLIVRGKLLEVKDMGTSDKPWALIVVHVVSKDRDGYECVQPVKIRAFGEMIKQEYHNSYRTAVGAEVFVPVTAEVNERYKEVSYQLAGLPVRLQPVAAQVQQKAG